MYLRQQSPNVAQNSLYLRQQSPNVAQHSLYLRQQSPNAGKEHYSVASNVSCLVRNTTVLPLMSVAW